MGSSDLDNHAGVLAPCSVGAPASLRHLDRSPAGERGALDSRGVRLHCPGYLQSMTSQTDSDAGPTRSSGQAACPLIIKNCFNFNVLAYITS